MVRPAGEIDGDTIAERCLRCGACAADRPQRSLDEVRRPGESNAPLLLVSQRSRRDARDVSLGVDEAERVERGALRLVQLRRRYETLGDDAVAQQRVLRDGKAVA